MSRTDERMAMLEGEMDNLRMKAAELEEENKKLKQEIDFYRARIVDLLEND